MLYDADHGRGRTGAQAKKCIVSDKTLASRVFTLLHNGCSFKLRRITRNRYSWNVGRQLLLSCSLFIGL